MKLLLPFTILCLLALGCREKEGGFFDPEPLPGSATWYYENNELPPATTTGENTMGCKINGEVWLPLRSAFGEGNKAWDITFEVSDEIISIRGFHRYNGFQGSKVSITTDENSIGNIEHYLVSHINDLPPECSNVQILGSSENGDYFNISRLDYQAQVLSGTFAFTIVDSLCTDTIYITDGRFDLKGN